MSFIEVEEVVIDVDVNNAETTVVEVPADALIEIEVHNARGAGGLSAYSIAVLEGFSGTEEEWLASLKGEDGDTHTPEAPPENYKTMRSQDSEWIVDDFPVSGDPAGTAAELVEAEAVLREEADDALSGQITSLASETESAVGDLESADAALDTRIDDLDTALQDNWDNAGVIDARVTQEVSDRTDGDAALAQSISDEADTRALADTALSDAIAAAISQEVSDRTDAITAAIDAVVDGAPTALDTLLELANALEDDADALAALVTVVDTKITSAQAQALVDVETAARIAAVSAAIATAAIDATTKANAAQANAISTASSDATTKANAAQAYAVQRANHTGTQAQSTVVDLVSDLAAIVASIVSETSRATTAEGTLTTNLSNEITARTTGDEDVLFLAYAMGGR